MDYRALFEDWNDLSEVAAGKAVFSTGDPADVLYFVLEGEIELRRQGVVTGVETAGGIIGESALLGVDSHGGSAVARTDTRLACLERTQLRELMAGNAEFALLVMAALAKRLRAVDAFIGDRLGDGDPD